jgi:hypothetical protein
MDSTICAACPAGWTSVKGSSRCQLVSFVFFCCLLHFFTPVLIPATLIFSLAHFHFVFFFF